MGIENIPLRIPEQWSPDWFRHFIVEVLSKLDTRNALGQGVVITSSGNSVATLSIASWIASLEQGYPDLQSEIPVLIGSTNYRITIDHLQSMLRQPIDIPTYGASLKGHRPTIA